MTQTTVAPCSPARKTRWWLHSSHHAEMWQEKRAEIEFWPSFDDSCPSSRENSASFSCVLSALAYHSCCNTTTTTTCTRGEQVRELARSAVLSLQTDVFKRCVALTLDWRRHRPTRRMLHARQERPGCCVRPDPSFDCNNNHKNISVSANMKQVRNVMAFSHCGKSKCKKRLAESLFFLRTCFLSRSFTYMQVEIQDLLQEFTF